MKKLNLIGILVLFAFWGKTQNIASHVVEYKPAPGQHINIENIGTPQAAKNMAANESSIVSLGGFGGYIILKFDEPCENDPENPYGIDFTIFGNAFDGSSEAGVVWVMKDKNQNGLPDDTWYEIAGSQHYYSAFKDYEITYFKTDTRNIAWKDVFGATGFMKANSYNLQEYYPQENYFPGYPEDSVSFSGTRIHAWIDRSNPMELTIETLAFGYADNHPKKQGINLSIPDNPYTEEVEGAGGDPIDISWAIDKSGKYVDLDEIHFVKIVTGYKADLGRLGEASTDVSYVVDVEPKTVNPGTNQLLIFYPILPERLVVGDETGITAVVFENGRYLEESIVFEILNEDIVSFGPMGRLNANKVGVAEISASWNDIIKKQTVKVVSIDSVHFLGDFSSVYPGDTISVDVKFFDNEDQPIERSKTYAISNSFVGELVSKEHKLYFVALNPGETEIRCDPVGSDFRGSKTVKVHSPEDKIKIYFTLKTEEENLLPLQWIYVGLTDLNGFVEDRQKDYSELNRPTLAHALLSGLQKAQLNFVFKDNEDSGGELYLFSLENDGLFTYGWGGKTDPLPFAKVWMAKLNGKQYLNKFDKYKVANGDTVVLYHVSDITAQWQFSRLLVNKDSVKKGDTIEILLEETTCSFQNDTIKENGFVPIKNQEIIADQSYFTDDNGKAEILLESDPPWIISAGNNSVLIAEKLTTNITRNYLQNIQIYPNPVKTNLNLLGKNLRGLTIRVYNMSGQLVNTKTATSDFETLNLISLPKGLYQLTIIRHNSTGNFKFLKQ